VGVDRRSLLLGVGTVGAFLAIDLGAVAYVHKWIGPRDGLTRQAFLDGFRHVYGTHSGFRRNHAKGVAVTGHFDSNGNGREVSRAGVFRPGRTSVTGRFSLSGGDPFMADTLASPHGLALAFDFADGTQWRTAMMNLPVFPVNSPQGFYDRLLASKPVAETGEPDSAAMSSLLAQHPEMAAALALIKQQPPSPGFAGSTYRSLVTFFCVDDAGVRTPVRWAFVPMQAATRSRLGTTNALFDTLVRQMRRGPLRWRLLLTVGEPDDPVLDASLPWPEDRRTIDAGLLTLTGIETEQAGNARDISFDPLVLPDGIEPSDDPLLSARSAVYGASYRARTGEYKPASLVQVDEVAL
jgi:catalase